MPTVAVAHYPEGAGHATRMVAVANALRGRGATVTLAGGGPGERFARMHGYEEFVPADVDYIGDFQRGSVLRVLANSVPGSVRRVREYADWLSRTDPAALVTDDMFAAMAAPRVGVPAYVVTHNAAVLYRHGLERLATATLTRLQVRVAEAFLFPAVWPPVAGDPPGVERVPPVALDDPETRRGPAPGAGTAGDGAGDDSGARGGPGPRRGAAGDGGPAATNGPGADPEDTRGDGGRTGPSGAGDRGADVVLVPSHFSTGYDALGRRLRAGHGGAGTGGDADPTGGGRSVTLVGGPDWEPVAALTPRLRRADAVVCSGYSTVMEAAVAGTPCVVYPFTSEQRGVARALVRNDVPGFRAARSPAGVARAVDRLLADPPTVPARPNGADAVARRVLGDVAGD